MKTPRKLVARNDRVSINHEFASLDAFLAEYVTNISASGVFIRSKAPLPIGTRVNLKFTVIIDELEIIEGIGEVMRVQDNPSGMGVVFVELTKHSQDLVSKLMTRRRLGERKPKAKRPATIVDDAVPAPAPPIPTRKSAAVPPPKRVPIIDPSVDQEAPTRVGPPPKRPEPTTTRRAVTAQPPPPPPRRKA